MTTLSFNSRLNTLKPSHLSRLAMSRDNKVGFEFGTGLSSLLGCCELDMPLCNLRVTWTFVYYPFKWTILCSSIHKIIIILILCKILRQISVCIQWIRMNILRFMSKTSFNYFWLKGHPTPPARPMFIPCMLLNSCTIGISIPLSRNM